MSRDLKEGGRGREANWKGMQLQSPGALSLTWDVGGWRSGKEVRRLEHREGARKERGEGRGWGREGHRTGSRGSRAPVSLSDLLLREMGTIGGSVQRRVMI